MKKMMKIRLNNFPLQKKIFYGNHVSPDKVFGFLFSLVVTGKGVKKKKKKKR